jgi:hypothetical protein
LPRRLRADGSDFDRRVFHQRLINLFKEALHRR